MSDLNFIDLFAGAGGLSEGFISKGFAPLIHVEFDKSAAFTLKTRAAYHYLFGSGNVTLYQSYIRGEIDRDTFYSEIPKQVLDSVENAEIGTENSRIFEKTDARLGKNSVDLIIGGPPCQAYSIVGRAPLKHRTDDVRTKLYLHYGRFLKRYKPKVFVFENVPGLLTASGGAYFKNLKAYYRRLGYQVEARILNAWDYGVIQKRERVIIVGWDKNLDFCFPDIQKVNANYSRDDVFFDLPIIGPGESRRVQNYIRPKNDYLKKTGIRNGEDYVTQHVARPHNDKDLRIYELAIRFLEDGRRLKNSDIPEQIRTQKNVKSFLDRFKVVDVVPHTVIAHIAKDGHHFIHPDRDQLRSISVREAARLQSFPDNYYFEGFKESSNRSAAFKQVGNAVPPLMAGVIAEKIKEMMKDVKTRI